VRTLTLILLLTGVLWGQEERRLVQVTSDPPGARVFEDVYDPERGTGFLGVTPCALWLDSRRSYELFLHAEGHVTRRYALLPMQTQVHVALEPSGRPVYWPLAALALLPLALRRRRVVASETPRADLAGDYELLDVLGEGTSARVYRARHRQFGDEFALKLWRSDSLDPASVERFRREVEVGCRLNHPHLLRVMAFGLCDRGAFVVSELLPGRTMEQCLAEMDRISVVDWLRQLALGLEALHGAGLVHRDLKPANVMISPQGSLKILDYGMVRVLDAASTLPGGALGTPHYMAPELMSSEAGSAADLYSLGVIAYRLVADRLPFPGDDAMAVVAAQLYKAPPPLEDGPLELRFLIAQLLDKNPSNRPTASQVANRLKEMCDVR
jgi:serine/threonine protein kinase